MGNASLTNMSINRIPDFFLLVDRYRKLYKAITILSKHKREEIYHIQVTGGHHLENLQEGGEQFIIHKVQIPENNDVIICINENHNWVNLKAPTRRDRSTVKEG